MDFGIIDGIDPPDPSAGPMPFAAFEPARFAMGDTVRFAERMQLVEMRPRDDLSSTGYALANPGEGYLVLQPSDTNFGVHDGRVVEVSPAFWPASGGLVVTR